MEIHQILHRLQKLASDSPAQFGVMSPQHMVEHLSLTVKISYDRIKIPEFEPGKNELVLKQELLYSSIQFPRGIRAPGLGEGALLPLRFSNLNEAKEELLKSLTNYTRYFKENPEARPVHPRFGRLMHGEWEIFHAKHFEHHLRQFGV
ncbi:DUF1569 domain-containing protein [Algoriphagus sp. H41]|uniref:DUF1569 domain-containing protein n=1 Tax=Algoriphagus oliviformis TaxID=2811231 RepID=A0ABS3C4B0_9BACT|nr:DUF1569 domain-containing protein [Algoriphagus oliviformis]MBN7811802.1 DUF1569 domain-containing protein [Algoriphagus oliviformis]